MHSVADAQSEILRHARPLRPGRERLETTALGLVLAEDVASDLDLPPFDKAMMDGYAVRAEECATPGAAMRVTQEITAGRVPSRPVGPGEAARIMTGAEVPAGADAVVMIEHCQSNGETVTVGAAVAAGQNIQPRGREVHAGETVLTTGTVLRPAELALLATVGRVMFATHAPPRVAVLATGDELVDAAARPGPGQIRNSNGPMLLALVVAAGAARRWLGVARDDRAHLAELVAEGLSHDVLIVAGGVSAGKLDLVPDVLREAGVTPHVHKVMMKPGKPLWFGTRGDTLVFGLPGNPVSAFVGFELFVRPALARLRGVANPLPGPLSLPLAEEFRHAGDRPTYHPAKVGRAAVGETIRPVRWLGPSDLRGLCAADALAVFDAGDRVVAAGTPVPVIRFSR